MMKIILILMIALLVNGCSWAPRTKGDFHLSDGEYEKAIVQYKKADRQVYIHENP